MITRNEKYLLRDLVSIGDLATLLRWRSEIPKEQWRLRQQINLAIQTLNRLAEKSPPCTS